MAQPHLETVKGLTPPVQQLFLKGSFQFKVDACGQLKFQMPNHDASFAKVSKTAEGLFLIKCSIGLIYCKTETSFTCCSVQLLNQSFSA